ncbi:MAG: hypothetical protein P4L48_18050 [Mycobacterium sp.]|nr:hypothetical protein [Mycobacterium sp.]
MASSRWVVISRAIALMDTGVSDQASRPTWMLCSRSRAVLCR